MCTHTRTRSIWVENPEYVPGYSDLDSPGHWESTDEYTYEDIDIGRYRCTQCNEVFYYTGKWREFYENGTPCFGSEHITRS